MKLEVMSKLFKFSIILSVFADAIAFNPKSVQADDHDYFDLTVKHSINGMSLGLGKDLLVDVCVDDDMAFTFAYGETVETALRAGDYFIDVKLWYKCCGYGIANW